jgi:hypothetical protein
MNRSTTAATYLVMAATLWGCCTERTVTFYRGATAETPQLPSRYGARLRDGEIQVAAELNPVLLKGITTYDNRTDSAAAMWVPKYQFGGHLYGAVNDKVELGIQARGAKSEWSNPTTTQALALDLSGRHVIQAGVGLRGNLSDPKEAFQLSLLTELNMVFRHERISKSSYCSNYWGDHWESSCYGLTNADAPAGKAEVGANLLFGLNSAWEVLPHLHLLGLAALDIRGTNNYSDTYTYDPSTESEPSSSSWTPTPVLHVGAGLEFRLKPIALSAVFHYPMTTKEALQYGPAATATAGLFF